jgi:hypothetical protein
MALVGSGFLHPGETEHFEVVLQKNVTHKVYVTPIDTAVDFDLAILDQNGNIIDIDTRTDPSAYGQVTPKWTGPFRLVVKSAAGTSFYGIRVES